MAGRRESRLDVPVPVPVPVPDLLSARPRSGHALPWTLAVGILACLSFSSSGCHSKATGYGGKLTFAYASGVEIENFVKPIAPGAKLDVVAFANGTDNELVVTKATSSRPSVVTVDSVGERKIVLRGREPGVAEVEITARDAAGNVLVDKMFFHVARPATHGIQHACTEAAEAAYVRGDLVDIFHNLATSDARPVIGYAYAPLRVEPAAALELVAQPQSWPLYRFSAPSANARVSVRSTVDDKVLTLRIVEKKDLTEATLDSAERIIEGRSAYAVAHVRLGETALCSQSALTKARSLTPEICRVTASIDEDPGSDSNREQLALITAVKFGQCDYEVTLPELGGGGIVLVGHAKVGRLEFPGERATAPATATATAPAPASRWFSGPVPWSRAAPAAGWLLASRVVALAGVMIWLRRRRIARTRD